MSDLNLRPLGDRVIVQRVEKEQRSPGGIVIPDTVAKGEKPVEGVVAAVGPGKHMENGDHRAIDVKKGDKVLFGKYAGSEVKIGDKDFLVLREDDIMAVII